ncbi:MAG: HAMP domain-containing protein, partial [Leptospiraceae bacterium]|nr:HAMP domain-containing protein [Leptospiraceae bacterium]
GESIFLENKIKPEIINKKLLFFQNQRKSYLSISFYNKECIKIADTSGLGIGSNCNMKHFSNLSTESTIEVIKDPFLKKRVLKLSSGIFNDQNDLIGYLTLNISVGTIHQFITSTNFFSSEKTLVDIIYGKSNIFYSNHLKRDDNLEYIQSEDSGKNKLQFIVTNKQSFSDIKNNKWVLIVKYPKDEALKSLNKIREEALTLISVLISISLFSIYFLSKQITKPILRLKEVALAFGKGDLDRRIENKSKDEIGDLSRNFNSMADELKALLKELEAKNIRLENLDKLKDEFLSNTSHELKTPLNGIIGIAESLIDGATGELGKPTKNNLSLIISSGKRLSNLVNDILDFSKLKNHELILQEKNIPIYSLIEMVIILMTPLAKKKNLNLINLVTEDIPNVKGDENRIQQIFLNLLGNSIKFTEKGFVKISAKVKKERIYFSIEDSGIGIPSDKFDIIFQSFEQVNASISREYGGTGIGLSITKNLVELHEGKIKVESEIGKGSIFTFDLPVYDLNSGIPDSDDKDDSSFDRLIDKLDSENITEQFIEEENKAIKAEIQKSNEDFTILIIDDEPINIQVLENLLKLENYNIVHAIDGFRGLDYLETSKPDLILLD